MLKRWNRFFYINTKIGADPDSSWKLQNEQQKTNEIYKLADFFGGGTLIEIYDEGGVEEPREEKKRRIWEYAEKHIKPNFLHENVQEISEADYRKWTAALEKEARVFIQQKEVEEEHGDRQLPGADGECQTGSAVSLDSILSNFSRDTYRCLWRLDRRGAVGETPFHLLFVNNTPKHLEIARMLLELYPGLSADAYMGVDYFGETAVHFAIINNDMKSLKLLLNSQHLDVHARARGKFFAPIDVKRGEGALSKKKYEGWAYYGEYPLSFAAGVGNYEMYDLLLKHHADVSKKDRFGNTALHMTVIHDKVDMYHHAVRHAEPRADPTEHNKEGLTPMALAAKLGRKDMFKAMLDISAKQFWSYSHMVCSAYPLRDLDTISPNGDTNWNSGLMKIIKGDDDEHLDMLQGGVVTSLLDKKWKIFAKKKFLRLLLYHVIHILFLSCAVYLRPYDVTTLITSSDASSIARYVFEILTCLGCFVSLFYAVREIYIETFFGFWQNIRAIPSRLLYYIGSLLILVCIPLRVLKLVTAEDWILAFAIPFLWTYFLFFARGLPLTGPFVTMIYNMIKTDLLRFFVIYAIILMTSGVAFYYQFKDRNVFAFNSELGTFMTLIQMSLGEFDYESVQQGRYQALSVILFIVYMMIVHVLLLNMLIAMMTRTYESVAKKTKKEWRRQWASIVIIMERSYSNEEKLHFQGKYSTPMTAVRVTSGGDAGAGVENGIEEIEERGLLWIHDQGVSSGRKKAAIAGMWKKSKKEALSGKLTRQESDDVREIRPAPTHEHGRRGMASWKAGVLAHEAAMDKIK